jgi:hypothetical protein
MKSRLNFNDDASFNEKKLIDHNEPIQPAPIKLVVAPTFWQKIWNLFK